MGLLTMREENRMRPAARGFSLIEVMVSLGILLVGILGTMQLQIQSLSWNQSSRAHSRAMELALELRAGIEALPYGDPRLAVAGGWSATPPPSFGPLLAASESDGTAWDDANPIPGVTLDAQIEADDLDPARPLYRRRWVVWGYTQMNAMNAGALVIAVSVTYHDKATAGGKEVVVYTQRVDPAAVFANLAVGGS